MGKHPGIRHIIVNGMLGIVIGLTLAGIAIGFNLFGLQALKTSTDIAPLAIAMLMGVFATTFGMLWMGIAVMKLGDKDQMSPIGRALSGLAIGNPQIQGR